MIDYNTNSELYPSYSKTIEQRQGTYREVTITETYTMPKSIFKASKTTYLIHLVLPLSDYSGLSTAYYTDDDYGMPEFTTEDDVVGFIDMYLRKAKKNKGI